MMVTMPGGALGIWPVLLRSGGWGPGFLEGRRHRVPNLTPDQETLDSLQDEPKAIFGTAAVAGSFGPQ